jgi:hypothetical protein
MKTGATLVRRRLRLTSQKGDKATNNGPPPGLIGPRPKISLGVFVQRSLNIGQNHLNSISFPVFLEAGENQVHICCLNVVLNVDTLHTTMSLSTAQVQEYWLPGYQLSRHIVLGHIQYFLGPSATVRPYTYQGREGYLIVGMRLTRVRRKPPSLN